MLERNQPFHREPPKPMSDAEIDIVKTQWALGLSASMIAGMLGNRSRNSVIGYIHRLGLSKLQGASTGIRKVAPTRSRAQRLSGFNSMRNCPADAQKKANPAPTAPLVERPTLIVDASRHVRPNDLKECHCRWPVGDPAKSDFVHCGSARIPGVSYCMAHLQLSLPEGISPKRTIRSQRSIRFQPAE